MHLKWDIFLTHLTARDNQVAVSSPQLCVGFLFLILYPGLLVLRLLLPSWWRAWAGWVVFWRRGTLRGRRGTISHPPSFHVAGVAQTHIHLRFAWQAWHLWHSVARLGWLGRVLAPRHFAWQAWQNLTSTFVSRGRRGTISHPPWFHVAGVAHMALGGALGLAWSRFGAAALCLAGVAHSHIHLRFTWQAWHNLTSTFVSRGRRGRNSHPPSLHVAGVAQTNIHCRFAWQAWHQLTSTFVLPGRCGTHGIGWRSWSGLVAA